MDEERRPDDFTVSDGKHSKAYPEGSSQLRKARKTRQKVRKLRWTVGSQMPQVRFQTEWKIRINNE